MPEITLGEGICAKLKVIYFSDKAWIDCYKQVAEKFTVMKNIMRKFYTEKTDTEILKELIKYDTTDIEDIFSK